MIIECFDAKFVIVGYLFGGLLIEILVGCGFVVVLVVILLVLFCGVLLLLIFLLRVSVLVLSNLFNCNCVVLLMFDQFCYLFVNVVDEEEVKLLFEIYVVLVFG